VQGPCPVGCAAFAAGAGGGGGGGREGGREGGRGGRAAGEGGEDGVENHAGESLCCLVEGVSEGGRFSREFIGKEEGVGRVGGRREGGREGGPEAHTIPEGHCPTLSV